MSQRIDTSPKLTRNCRFVLCPHQQHIQTPSSKDGLSIVVSDLCIHSESSQNISCYCARETNIVFKSTLKTKPNNEVNHPPPRPHGPLRRHRPSRRQSKQHGSLQLLVSIRHSPLSPFPPPLANKVKKTLLLTNSSLSHRQEGKKHGTVRKGCTNGKKLKNGKCKRGVLRVRSAGSEDFFDIPDVEDVHWGAI